jgi:NADH dehydrogenase
VHCAKPIHPKRISHCGRRICRVEVLRRIQDRFQNDVTVDITIVTNDNFFLLTPMLHEVASGMIETRHIGTPIGAFCNRAKIYAVKVKIIDLNNIQVHIELPLSSSVANTNTRNIPNSSLTTHLKLPK